MNLYSLISKRKFLHQKKHRVADFFFTSRSPVSNRVELAERLLSLDLDNNELCWKWWKPPRDTRRIRRGCLDETRLFQQNVGTRLGSIFHLRIWLIHPKINLKWVNVWPTWQCEYCGAAIYQKCHVSKSQRLQSLPWFVEVNIGLNILDRFVCLCRLMINYDSYSLLIDFMSIYLTCFTVCGICIFMQVHRCDSRS